MSEKLSLVGLEKVWAKIKENFVAKETGKGLSANDFTAEYKSKLDGIAEGAQVNVLDSIKVNGVAQTITDKGVDIAVPTGALASKDKVAVADMADDLVTLVDSKVAKEAGKGLSTNDYDDAAVEEVAKIANKADKATTLSGYGITDAYTKTEVDTEINQIKSDIASVYKVKGTVAFADLPKEGMVAGDVYNVTNSFTADTTFVTGEQGLEYPAGTNVVWTAAGWDCLAGTYDFSGFALKSELPVDITEAQINEICVL